MSILRQGFLLVHISGRADFSLIAIPEHLARQIYTWDQCGLACFLRQLSAETENIYLCFRGVVLKRILLLYVHLKALQLREVNAILSLSTWFFWFFLKIYYCACWSVQKVSFNEHQ